MPWKAMLREVDQLRGVGTLLETLGEQNAFLSEPLTTLAGQARNTADMLEVLIAVRGPENISRE